MFESFVELKKKLKLQSCKCSIDFAFLIEITSHFMIQRLLTGEKVPVHNVYFGVCEKKS